MTVVKLIVHFFQFRGDLELLALVVGTQDYLKLPLHYILTCINKATLTLVFPQMQGIVQTERLILKMCDQSFLKRMNQCMNKGLLFPAQLFSSS